MFLSGLELSYIPLYLRVSFPKENATVPCFTQPHHDRFTSWCIRFLTDKAPRPQEMSIRLASLTSMRQCWESGLEYIFNFFIARLVQSYDLGLTASKMFSLAQMFVILPPRVWTGVHLEWHKVPRHKNRVLWGSTGISAPWLENYNGIGADIGGCFLGLPQTPRRN